MGLAIQPSAPNEYLPTLRRMLWALEFCVIFMVDLQTLLSFEFSEESEIGEACVARDDWAPGVSLIARRRT